MSNLAKILLAFILILVLSRFVPNNSWQVLEQLKNTLPQGTSIDQNMSNAGF